MILVILIAVCLIILIVMKIKEKENGNVSNKLKKWLNALFISILVFLIALLLNKFISIGATIFTIVLYISGVAGVIALIACTIIGIKDKEKLPVWANLLQGIVIAVIVIGIIAKVIDYNRTQEDKKNINEYTQNSSSIINSDEKEQNEEQNNSTIEQTKDEENEQEYDKAKLAAKEYALSKMGNNYEYMVVGNAKPNSEGVYSLTVHVEEPYYGGGSTSVGYFSIEVKEGYVISADYNE